MLLDLHTGLSGGRSGGLVFPSLEEFPAVCWDPHKGFSEFSEAAIDVFLKPPCFLYDPVNAGNVGPDHMSPLKAEFSPANQRRGSRIRAGGASADLQMGPGGRGLWQERQ